jgi:hypothetical protein
VKNIILKVAGLAAACFLISFAAAKLAGVAKYPDDLGRRYMVKLSEGHEVSFDQEILIEGVDEIEIETVSSDIRISQNAAKDAQGKMRAKFHGPDYLGFTSIRAGNKLYLKVANKTEKQNGLQWNFDELGNELTLDLPAQVKRIAVKTVSGDVAAKAVRWEKLSVAGTSSDVNLEEAELGTFELKTVSGDVRCGRCKLGSLSAGTVSGDISLLLSGAAPQIVAGTTSGDVELRFEQRPSVKLEISSVSGDIALDPAFGKVAEDARRAALAIGGGKGRVAVKTLSGDVRIGMR